jgi:hypothetical protein
MMLAVVIEKDPRHHLLQQEHHLTHTLSPPHDSAKKASRRESTWKNLAVVARRQRFKSVKLKRKTDSINVVSKTLSWEWPAWQRENRP